MACVHCIILCRIALKVRGLNIPTILNLAKIISVSRPLAWVISAHKDPSDIQMREFGGSLGQITAKVL